MRQIRRERIWTALAGREAANPTEGVSKVVHRGLPRQPQRCAGGIAVGYPCPLPFGPSLRNVQNCSRRCCARPLPGARPYGTCLRQSNFVPDEVVAMLYRTSTFKLYTKSQAKRVHHTQTPVRPQYRSHPAIVIKTRKRDSKADQ